MLTFDTVIKMKHRCFFCLLVCHNR